jgi:hypothetical protein
MQNDPTKINTIAISQFINQVKSADLGNQREVRLDMVTAKNLSYTLSLVMTRLAGNYETLLTDAKKAEPVVDVRMDGGSWDK